MKKSIVCLAVSGISTVAMAQSSVSLFGVIDMMVGHYNAQGVSSVTKLNSSGIGTSRFGFRGTEDLGDGLYAGFWLESQIAADNGTGASSNTNNTPSGLTPAGALTFNVRSTVSLGGPFGEIRLGRDYIPTVWNVMWWDPFTAVGVGSATNLAFAGTSGSSVNAMRNSNSVGYLFNSNAAIGSRSGFYGQFQYAMGEGVSTAANASDGDSVSALIGYAEGRWNGAIAYAKTKMLANKDYTLFNFGGSLELDVVKLSISYNIADSGLPGTRNVSYLLGARIPLGAGSIPISFMRTKQDNAAGSNATQFAIGYAYNLSKRTAIYTNYARINNRNGAAFSVGRGQGLAGIANVDSSGWEVGMRHAF